MLRRNCGANGKKPCNFFACVPFAIVTFATVLLSAHHLLPRKNNNHNIHAAKTIARINRVEPLNRCQHIVNDDLSWTKQNNKV